MILKKYLTISIGLFLLLSPLSSWAIFGADEFRIEKFCQSDLKRPRQTLIYIDNQVLVKGDSQWAKDLLAKLSANLMPSEPVTLVEMSPISGEMQELWQGCYPNYTSAELEKIKKESNSFFGSDPIKQLKNQQAFFRKQLGDALGKLLIAKGRNSAEIKINDDEPPKKQIIRAFSNDGARFDSTHGAIRVIIYSDMIENSDLGSSLNEKTVGSDKTLSLDFKNAVFYVYGVGVTLSSQGIATDRIKSYWKDILDASTGHLIGFGSNLIIPTTVPLSIHSYDIEVIVDKKNDIRNGKMQFFVDHEGHLQDSFISIANKVQSIIQDGSFLCKDTKCTLSANTKNSVITTEGNNEIKLTGSIEHQSGSLQIPNAKLPNGKDAVFDITSELNK